MKIRLAIALFLLLGICSVASMEPVTETSLVADGVPIPCWPPGASCPGSK